MSEQEKAREREEESMSTEPTCEPHEHPAEVRALAEQIKAATRGIRFLVARLGGRDTVDAWAWAYEAHKHGEGVAWVLDWVHAGYPKPPSFLAYGRKHKGV